MEQSSWRRSYGRWQTPTREWKCPWFDLSLGFGATMIPLTGGMAEWSKAAVLKTVDRKVRGFESLSLRHPVWPIVALQRRVRFSAPLARFCRIRCHQRRARRAELASFSGFVSNLDFRVPRSRQRGERAADRAVQRRKRGRPKGPESRPGLPWRSRLARSGPGAPRPP